MPIVASNFPLWRDLIAESGCGVLVNPAAPADIARGMLAILDNPEQAVLMAGNGRRLHLSEYNWIGEERRLLRFISNLDQAGAGYAAESP
ncbi:MAG: hypothetical protein K8R90_01245 [Candidatus Cloacimonetes bacterium]|nr:hypothetical protein [Candidatus Cloacimonadota bacterium]